MKYAESNWSSCGRKMVVNSIGGLIIINFVTDCHGRWCVITLVLSPVSLWDGDDTGWLDRSTRAETKF